MEILLNDYRDKFEEKNKKLRTIPDPLESILDEVDSIKKERLEKASIDSDLISVNSQGIKQSIDYRNNQQVISLILEDKIESMLFLYMMTLKKRRRAFEAIPGHKSRKEQCKILRKEKEMKNGNYSYNNDEDIQINEESSSMID